MTQCIIMRGPSGIGKSTWIKKNYPDAGLIDGPIICSADDYFWVEKEDGTKVYEFDPRCLAVAHSECLSKFVNVITSREPMVIVDNTNTAKWEYINYLNVARAFGYTVTLHEFTVQTIAGLRELLKRQENGKQTPTDIVCRMVLDFEPGAAHKVVYSTIEQQMEQRASSSVG